MTEQRIQFGRNQITLAVGAGLAVVLGLVGALVALSGGGGSDDPAAPEPTPTSAPSATASATTSGTSTPTAVPTPIKNAGILDGMPMSDEEWAARKDLLPVAVMLDNTTGAVPHIGLDKADLVYETFVEGGITRLMAVYWRQEADKILPVRSARTPFVIWVDELGALYGHAGSASTDNDANATGQIFEWAIRDLNAFSPGSNTFYYRDNERSGPYDLATSTGYLRQAADILKITGTPLTERWKFRERTEEPAKGEPAGGIEIGFSGRLYTWQLIQWKWDAESKRYLRFQFGGPHVDGVSGEQLAFATVIVMRADASVVDEAGHVLLEQFGEGEATVFTGGQAYAGTWKKADRKARTRFYDANGNEIAFERGPIFIEVIGQQSSTSFVAAAADLPELPKYEPPVFQPGPVEEDVEPLPTATLEPSPTTTASPTPSTAPTSPASQSPSASAEPSATTQPQTATVVPQATPTPEGPESPTPG